MGSSYKRVILEEQIRNVLRQCHGRVTDRRKRDQTSVTENIGDNNIGDDINSGESPILSEIAVSDFSFSSRQPPTLQEIPIQKQTENEK